MVTDTAFRKSSLGKSFLEKIVSGTSKNWPYHTDWLVFCLKLKLSLVCEYQNYYYNPGSYTFVTLPLEILDKKNFLYIWKFCKIVLHHLEIPRSETKTHENSTRLYSWKSVKHPLITPGNCTSFLVES